MKLTRSENQESTSSFEPKKLYTGIAPFKLIAVNPDKKRLAELLGMPEDKIEKEPTYTGERDGILWVSLNFWLEANTPDKEVLQASYFISDKIVVGSQTGKTQWVSNTGDFAWVDSKENLQHGFTKYQEYVKDENTFKNIVGKDGETFDKSFREAIGGEADLYLFLRALLSHVEWKKPSDNTMLIDVKKLFRDPIKYAKTEYGTLIDADRDESLIDTVIGLAKVDVKEKDGEKVQRQGMSKWWIPDNMKDSNGNSTAMKQINNIIQNKAWDKAQYDIGKFYKAVTKAQHGEKGNYKLQTLAEYDPQDFLNESNETIRHDNSQVSDTNYD